MFGENEKLRKYQNVKEIIDNYYKVRLSLYNTRKNYLIDAISKELVILRNKKQYIEELLNDTIDLRKKKKEVLIKLLEDKMYDKIENDDEYKYLLKMSMDSVTEENVEKIKGDYYNKNDELELIKSKSIETMWNEELETLQTEYFKYRELRVKLQESDKIENKSKKIIKKIKSKK